MKTSSIIFVAIIVGFVVISTITFVAVNHMLGEHPLNALIMCPSLSLLFSETSRALREMRASKD